MSKKCLLLMPFSDPDGTNSPYWSGLYLSLSHRVRATLPNYDCELFYIGSGAILPNLLVRIVGSDLILCDLTHMKPNVLFELGASIMLGKPTILLAQGPSPIPSDISNYAFINYSFNEEEGRLNFPQNGERCLFEQSLEYMTERYTSESFISTDTTLARTLKAIASALKHAIKLERENAILAPALKSLFDTLVSDNAKELSDFIENNKKNVSVRIEGPKILFNVLIALLDNLTHEDRYDSITWKKHWTGPNEQDSLRFLKRIVQNAEDLPTMRRVFLVGVNQSDREGWVVNPEDQKAVKNYYNATLNLPHKIKNRVLFLPDQLITPVAAVCHMGRITKGTSTVYVFSEYSDNGALNSFRLVRDGTFNWDYEDFWDLSTAMEKFAWNVTPLPVSFESARFSRTADAIRFEPSLETLLDRVGAPRVQLS